MIKAKLSICLICLSSIVVTGAEPNGIEAEAVWQSNRDYTFMWWAYGLRDPSRVFHIQTSNYGLSFDFDDFEPGVDLTDRSRGSAVYRELGREGCLRPVPERC